jgi:S-adenosylmethionine uptake transporter
LKPPAPNPARASLWIALSSALFALMAACVKQAAEQYHPMEIVFYRGLVGVVLLGMAMRWRGDTVATPHPWAHGWRSAIGVTSLALWFYAISGLPLSTATTLNYMSGIWIAVFLMGAAMLNRQAIDWRLSATVLTGFLGVILILRPTIQSEQAWHAMGGLMSGLCAGFALLQVASLGRLGEPESRTVFYFSLGSMVAGALSMLVVGASPHTWAGAGLLLAVGGLSALAQMAMTRAFARGSALLNAALQYLGIVFSVLFGLLLFGEKPDVLSLLGIAVIIGSGIAATWLRLRQVPDTALEER